MSFGRSGGARQRESKAPRVLAEKVEENFSHVASESVSSDNFINLEFREILEMLENKRPSIRTSAYLRLIRVLSLRYCAADLHDFVGNFAEEIEKSLSSGDLDELEAALQVFNLMAVTIGVHDLSFLFGKLKNMILKRESHRVRALALQSFSMLLFFSPFTFASVSFLHHVICLMTIPSSSTLPVALKVEENLGNMDHVALGGGKAKTEEENENTSDQTALAISTALASLNLLLSRVPVILIGNSEVESSTVYSYLDRYAALLEHEDLSVRMNACVSVGLLLGQDSDDDTDTTNVRLPWEEVGEELDSGATIHWTLVDEDSNNLTDQEDIEDNSVTEHEVVSILHRLSHDGDRHKGKKDLISQRNIFRSVLASVEDGEQPSEVMRPNDQKVEFIGWKAYVRLEFFRSVLGTGFITHLLSNPFMARTFDLTDLLNGMSRLEEREFSKLHEKEKNQSRNKDRSNKSSRNNDSFE